MLNIKHKKSLLLTILIALSSIMIASCGGGSDSEKAPPPSTTPPVVIVPETEHHENDKIKTQTTSQITVASNTVTTTEKNFAHETKVTDPMQVSSIVDTTYPVGKVLNSFIVENNFVIGSDKIDNLTSKIFSYSLSSNAVITTIDADNSISGFSYNGFILAMDAGEILNMYHIDDKGVIGQHFFTTDSGSGGWAGAPYLDHDYGYYVDSDNLIKIKIHDTTSKETIYTFPSQSISTLIVSDENSLYATYNTYSFDNGDNAEVILINKGDETYDKKLSVNNAKFSDITVDGNYIYVSDKVSGDVLVFNKHTLADSGRIDIGEDTLVDYVDGKLYIYLLDKKELQKHTVSFAAP